MLYPSAKVFGGIVLYSLISYFLALLAAHYKPSQ